MKIRRDLSFAMFLSVMFQAGADEIHRGESWVVERLGPTINTEFNERFSMISSDGLALYFASDRPDSIGPVNARGRKEWDMYVAWRSSVTEPFGTAVNLGPEINSPYGDHSAAFSNDGHWMYFASSRPGGCGGYDLYISHRVDVEDPLGWGPPQHLGCTANTEFDEACPFFITDEQNDGAEVYFVRNSGRGQRDFQIFVSRVGEGVEVLQSASPVPELNSLDGDYHFEPRHGLIWSRRAGGYGAADIWRTGMSHETNRWTEPENIGPAINSVHNETLPSSTAGGVIYFPSDRPDGYGGYDIYMAIPSR